MMKKNKLFVLTGVLVFTLIMFTGSLCFGQQGVKPGVKNSFDAVTSKLDKGGNVYVYVSTERVIKTLDEFVMKLRQLLQTSIEKSGEEKDNLAIFDFVYGLIKRSGVMEISGVGMSSVPVSGGLNHSKSVIHHYKENSKGLIWKLYETSPHKLSELRMLPVDTTFAVYGDFKFNVLWNWIKNEANASNIPSVKESIAKLEPNLQAAGIDLNKMLDAMSNGMGYIFTFDKTKMCKLPIGASGIEIPDPAFALIIKVKDDFLFNFFKSKMTFAVPTEEKNMKTLRIPFPLGKMPITLDPMIVQKDNRLIIVSNKKLLDAMFTAQEKGNGLISKPEFKKLSANVPEIGNSFSYSDGEFFKLIMNFQQQKKESEPEANPADTEFFKNISSLLWKDMASYGIMQAYPEGMTWITNHTMNYENLVLLPVTLGVGAIGAIAVPNLLTATQKGKQKSTIADMKAIATAIESYMTDFGYAPKGKTLQEIQKDLVPFHIKTLPLKDGWGNDFLYMHGTGDKADHYYVASPGKDGVFIGWDQEGFYPVSTMKDFENDIILINAKFVYGPEFKSLEEKK